MRKFIWALIVISGTAVAQERPTVIGFITNKAEGEITLTGAICKADKSKFFLYVRDRGGKISLTGCWSIFESDIFVTYSDGDIYSYPVTAVNFTPEYDAWYQRNQQQEKYQ